MTDLQNRIIETIKKEKLIAILRGIPEDKIIQVVEALKIAGVKLIEVTFDHTSSETVKQTLSCISLLKDKYGDTMEIGAGTVIDFNDVYAAKNAGATFMISPNTDENVIRGTKKLGLVSIPGAYTPTEICNAYACGADFVKLFPLINNPADYIKAVKAPLKHIPMLAVGGVTPENTASVIKAGVCGIGVASGIVKASEVTDFETDKDFEIITKRALSYIKELQQ